MNRDDILMWLRETDERRLADLWRLADDTRRLHVGGAVHLRGLVEVSNHCVRRCAYCGLRAPNGTLTRYRMTTDETVDCARRAVEFGFGTLVMQAGEDDALTVDWVSDVIRRVKAETPLAITLSLGERSDDEFAVWRAAGADRYLLRFETSNRALYERIHPARDGVRSDRIKQLGVLRELGYETGSGVMVGIPGQTLEDLADDIDLFRELDLDMIGVGPFMPHPDTPLGRPASETRQRNGEDDKIEEDRVAQPPSAVQSCRGHFGTPQADRQSMHSRGRLCHTGSSLIQDRETMTYKIVALARLVCPDANIPSTTALGTINRDDGQRLGLECGANVIMPNLTPTRRRRLYTIYPGKGDVETAEEAFERVTRTVATSGRTIGFGCGDSPNAKKRKR